MTRGWIWKNLRNLLLEIKYLLWVLYFGLLPPEKPKPKPKQQIKVPVDSDLERLARVYTNFSGADLIFIVNDVVIGEANHIRWQVNLEDPEFPVGGNVNFIVFDRDTLASRGIDIFTPGVDIKFILFFENEYGVRSYREIKGVKFVGFAGGIGVDNIILEEDYTFKAKFIGPLIPCSLEEKRKIFAAINGEQHGAKQ